MRWQDVRDLGLNLFKKRSRSRTLWIGGSTLSFFSVLLLIGFLTNISVSYTGDIYCAEECISYINITSTYWRVCFAEDFEIVQTDPKVKVEVLVPARGKGNWRPFRPGYDCIDRKTKSRPLPARFKIIGHKSATETIKWSVDKFDIDPLWIGKGKKIVTPSSEKTCVGNARQKECQLTLYTNIRNVYEESEWKKIEKAKSLKGSGYFIQYLKKDENFTIKVLDFNYSSISVELDSKIKDKNIPIKILKKDKEKKKKKIKEIKEKFPNKKSKTFAFGLDYFLEFGFNSTIISIESNSTWNDTWIVNGTLFENDNFGTTEYLRAGWDDRENVHISRGLMDTSTVCDNIPTGANITWVKLEVNITGVGETANNLSIRRMKKGWKELEATANKNDSANNWDASLTAEGTEHTFEQVDNISFNPSTGQHNFTVTSYIINMCNGTYNKSGLLFKNIKAEESGNPAGDTYIKFGSAEHSTPSSRPTYHINYTIARIITFDGLEENRTYEYETTASILASDFALITIHDWTSRYINVSSPLNYLIDILRVGWESVNVSSGSSFNLTIDNRSDLHKAEFNLTGFDEPQNISLNYSNNFAEFPGTLRGNELYQNQSIFGGVSSLVHNITFLTTASKTIYINFSTEGNLSNRTGSINFSMTASAVDRENEFSFREDMNATNMSDFVSLGTFYPIGDLSALNNTWEDFSNNETATRWANGKGVFRDNCDQTQAEKYIGSDKYCIGHDKEIGHFMYTDYINLDNVTVASIQVAMTFSCWGQIDFEFTDLTKNILIGRLKRDNCPPSSAESYCNYTFVKLSKKQWRMDARGFSCPAMTEIDVSSLTPPYYFRLRVVKGGSGVHPFGYDMRFNNMNIGGIYLNKTTGRASGRNATFSGIHGPSQGLLEGNFTTHKINTTPTDVGRAILEAVFFEPSGTNITYYLSNDDGATFEKVTLGEAHVFSSTGDDLMVRFNLKSDSNITSPQVFEYTLSVVPSELNNLDIDIGGDGDVDIEINETLDETNTPISYNGSSIPFNTYINNSCLDLSSCLVPITFISGSGGVIEVSHMNATFNINPVRLNVSPLQDLSEINITPTYSGGKLQFSDVKFDFRGSKNITVEVTDTDGSNSENHTIHVVYSPFEMFFPSGQIYWELFPSERNQSNIEPYGQNATDGIWKVNSSKYHDSGVDIYMKLNNSIESCVTSLDFRGNNFTRVLSNSDQSLNITNLTTTEAKIIENLTRSVTTTTTADPLAKDEYNTIDETVGTTATYTIISENIVKDSSGRLHVAYINTSSTWYSNSSDNGSTWNGFLDLDVDSSYRPGIAINSTDGLFVYTRLGAILKGIFSSDNGSTFDSPIDLITFQGAITLDVASCVFDSNDIWHCCAIEDANDLLYYTNSSEFPTHFEVHGNTSDDSDNCDIEVDSNNCPYIVAYGSDEDNIEIWSNCLDGFGNNSRILINDATNTGTGDGLSIAIRDDLFHVAFIETTGTDKLVYCNSSIVNASNWGCKNITNDSPSPNTPTIGIDENGGTHIIYSSSSTVGSGELYYANSTDGISWTNQTELQTITNGAGNFPSIQDSNFPSFNRMNSTVNYVWTNGTNSLNFDSFDAFSPTPTHTTTTAAEGNIFSFTEINCSEHSGAFIIPYFCFFSICSECVLTSDFNDTCEVFQ